MSFALLNCRLHITDISQLNSTQTRLKSYLVNSIIRQFRCHAVPDFSVFVKFERSVTKFGKRIGLYCQVRLSRTVYCTVLYGSTRNCTVLFYDTELLCTILYVSVRYCDCMVHHCTAMRCAVYCTVLHSNALCCTILHEVSITALPQDL